MTELIPVDASSPSCPLDVAVAPQEDGTSVPPSSLEIEVFVDPKHPNKVLEGLNKLRLNNASCDVTLCCEGKEFPCHRYVLASFTSYFEAMFLNGMVESTQDQVVISGVDPQMIDLLLSYAYRSKVSISTANVQALLAASDFLDVTAVKEACLDYIERHMDVDNCIGIYCFSVAHSFKMLEKHSMDYIFEHFSVIYLQEEFLSLSVERLTEILASDHLNVPKEDMVFEAAMLWLDKCVTRGQSFEKVLEHIRLPLISSSYLHTVIESLDVVKEYQGCQRFISEAKNPYCNTARPRRTPVIVIVGGQTDEEEFHKVESFDPLTRQWNTLGRLPAELRGIRDHAVVLSGSVLYLAGGFFPNDEYYSRDMWRYDVPHNSWLKMAPMIKRREKFSMVMLDGYVLAVGGYSSSDSIEKYDPKTNTWQLTKSGVLEGYYSRYRYQVPAVVALDGLLYVIGSCSAIKEKPELALMANYNHETSVWTELAPMQILRDDLSACTVSGKIYITGGTHDIVVEDSMECYNPETNQWTMCAPMQVPRESPGMAVVDGKIYILGCRDNGEEIGIAGKIEQYCEETNSWETVGQMPPARYNLNCVTLRLRNDHPPAVEDEKKDEDERYYSRRRRRHEDDTNDDK